MANAFQAEISSPLNTEAYSSPELLFSTVSAFNAPSQDVAEALNQERRKRAPSPHQIDTLFAGNLGEIPQNYPSSDADSTPSTERGSKPGTLHEDTSPQQDNGGSIGKPEAPDIISPSLDEESLQRIENSLSPPFQEPSSDARQVQQERQAPTNLSEVQIPERRMDTISADFGTDEAHSSAVKDNLGTQVNSFLARLGFTSSDGWSLRIGMRQNEGQENGRPFSGTTFSISLSVPLGNSGSSVTENFFKDVQRALLSELNSSYNAAIEKLQNDTSPAVAGAVIAQDLVNKYTLCTIAKNMLSSAESNESGTEQINLVRDQLQKSMQISLQFARSHMEGLDKNQKTQFLTAFSPEAQNLLKLNQEEFNANISSFSTGSANNALGIALT
jgi:hypothetical protein